MVERWQLALPLGKCSCCHRAFTCYPPGLYPRRQYQLDVVAEVVAGVALGSELIAHIAATVTASSMSARRWTAWVAALARAGELVAAAAQVDASVATVALPPPSVARHPRAAAVLAGLEALGTALVRVGVAAVERTGLGRVLGWQHRRHGDVYGVSAAPGVSPRRWRTEVARPPRSVPSMTGGNDDDETALARALVCYRLIAEAAAAPHGARTALLRLAASKEVAWPDGRAVSVTVRTLQRWLARFRRGGLPALVRTPRKDKGRVRAVSEAALARVITLRKEEPERSTPTLIDIVERADEVAKGALRRSTLDRHLDRRGASRRMLHVLGAKRHVKLAFPHPIDFVVGDFHQGPYYRDVHGEIRRAVLGAFIDHCSRFVPESRYGLVEDQMHVRRGLRALCTRVGPPHKLYVDGGPGYQGARFDFGCSQLGIEVAHSAPYVSEGRGLVERLNKTVKDAFEIEVRLRPEPPTLDELNAFWWAWLDERYHRRVHSELGEPPLER